MGSGDSPEDCTNCNKMFTELPYWQKIVTQNAIAIRAALNGGSLPYRRSFAAFLTVLS
jgi:hypothetical protein